MQSFDIPKAVEPLFETRIITDFLPQNMTAEALHTLLEGPGPLLVLYVTKFLNMRSPDKFPTAEELEEPVNHALIELGMESMRRKGKINADPPSVFNFLTNRECNVIFLEP